MCRKGLCIFIRLSYDVTVITGPRGQMRLFIALFRKEALEGIQVTLFCFIRQVNGNNYRLGVTEFNCSISNLF